MREKKLYSQLIYRGRIVDLYKDNVALEDGKREAIREVVRHREAICVLPVEGESIILVSQFRYPVGREFIEIPAGIIEEGEKPEEAAKRELKEETGYSAKSIKKLFSFYSSPGFTDEKLHLFIAEGLEPGEQDMDPDEEIDVVKM
ncbi:MAG: NUDIX domain-containing protein, partial [Proteobacteria bacterium]|nr:NUDIX domain-containing protein [Pseudomonadota bacterium]